MNGSPSPPAPPAHPMDNITQDNQARDANHYPKMNEAMVGKSRQQILDRVNKKSPNSIYSEAVKGNEDEVYEQLCREVVDVDERNPSNGRTLLHEASANGHLTLAQLLIEEFAANINCRTYLGKETPLLLACSMNDRSMVYLLLNYGADPNIQNKFLSAPLHYAQKRSVASLLVKRGGVSTMRDSAMRTPVQVALEREERDEELIEFLTRCNEGQEKDEYKKEIEANKELRKREEEAQRAAHAKRMGQQKMGFKERTMREYERWRGGDSTFLNEIERRKKLRADKPKEYFGEGDEEWRKKPPKGHDPTA